MSGDGNYSGSGGYDLNTFGDWEGMYNSLARSSMPGTQGSSTPGTQGSATPAPYEAPHFDVGAYYRPSSPPRPTQGLSQIRENFSNEPAPEYLPVEEEEEEEEDLGRHPYSPKETLALYNAWLKVSYDPIVGNQQTRLVFWKKVTEAYHEIKPKNARNRNVKMLRSHFDRCDVTVKKFCGIYTNEAANYQSGASEADILQAALRVYKDDAKKDFKHVDVWGLVRDEERWAGGVRSSTGSSSKRTKHTAGGQYSSSDGGGSGNASQEVEGTPTDDVGGSSGSRRRPGGNKAAKAARARGRGRGSGESSQVSSGSGLGSNTLMSMYLLATMADTSKMTPGQYEAHMDGIEHMRAQLGIRSRSNLGAPPPGDDSPAE